MFDLTVQSFHPLRTCSAVVLLVAISFGMPAAADALSEAAGRYRIDNSSSGTLPGRPDRRGRRHPAAIFGSYAGSFRIDGNNVANSSVSFTLYPKSVRATKSASRISCAPTRFSTWPHPEITFRSTSAIRVGKDEARIDGVLTARGKARKAAFDATVRTQRRQDFLPRDRVHLPVALRQSRHADLFQCRPVRHGPERHAQLNDCLIARLGGVASCGRQLRG